MRALNMATIAASLERSFKDCSLDNRHQRNRGADEEDETEQVSRGRTSVSDDSNLPNSASNTALELNSHVSLPYSWEQCLDLKTGEIYYINWRTGMRVTEDPRTMSSGSNYYSGDLCSEEEEEDGSCESEESSSEYSSPSSSSKQRDNYSGNHRSGKDRENVLVVAGCKSCLMYFMVPKQMEDCPKCTGQLLHFDRPDHASS